MTAAGSQLFAKFERPPRENNVLWRVLHTELLHYSSTESWALYTATHVELDEVLMSEGKFEAAVHQYIEAFYLSGNGPRNIDWEVVREGYPRFVPSENGPIFGVERIVQMMVACELSSGQVESKFLLLATDAQRKLNLPASPAATWLEQWPRIST